MQHRDDPDITTTGDMEAVRRERIRRALECAARTRERIARAKQRIAQAEQQLMHSEQALAQAYEALKQRSCRYDRGETVDRAIRQQ